MKKAAPRTPKTRPEPPPPPVAPLRTIKTHEDILALHTRPDFADMFEIMIRVGDDVLKPKFELFRHVTGRYKAAYHPEANLQKLSRQSVEAYLRKCVAHDKPQRPFHAQKCDVTEYFQLVTSYKSPEQQLVFHRAQNISVNILIRPSAPIADEDFLFELFRSESTPHDIRRPTSFPENEGLITIFNDELTKHVSPTVLYDPSHVVFCVDHSNEKHLRVTELSFEICRAAFLTLMNEQLQAPPAKAVAKKKRPPPGSST